LLKVRENQYSYAEIVAESETTTCIKLVRVYKQFFSPVIYKPILLQLYLQPLQTCSIFV